MTQAIAAACTVAAVAASVAGLLAVTATLAG